VGANYALKAPPAPRRRPQLVLSKAQPAVSEQISFLLFFLFLLDQATVTARRLRGVPMTSGIAGQVVVFEPLPAMPAMRLHFQLLCVLGGECVASYKISQGSGSKIHENWPWNGPFRLGYDCGGLWRVGLIGFLAPSETTQNFFES
jgi:hypothetical protein